MKSEKDPLFPSHDRPTPSEIDIGAELAPRTVERPDRDLLIRIDERTKQLTFRFEEAKRSFVRKEDFDPVKRIVYGMVGIILTAVVTALVALVVMKSKGG